MKAVDKQMSREQLLQALRDCMQIVDTGTRHIEADRLLLEFINDDEVSDVYAAIEKIYFEN